MKCPLEIETELMIVSELLEAWSTRGICNKEEEYDAKITEKTTNYVTLNKDTAMKEVNKNKNMDGIPKEDKQDPSADLQQASIENSH